MAAVVAIGLLGVGIPVANAHAVTLSSTVTCDKTNGEWVVTYTGTTTVVPDGKVARLTVDPQSGVSAPETVTGNTTFTFTQIVSGVAKNTSAKATLTYSDFTSYASGQVTFDGECSPVVPPVPEKPTSVGTDTSRDTTNCDSTSVTTTKDTTTPAWVLVNNVWVPDKPVVTQSFATRPKTAAETAACSVVPPAVPAKPQTPAVPAETTVIVSSEVALPAVVPAATAVNPLPVAAAAGQADTSTQPVLGGLAGFAAFLMLGLGAILRRRRGEV